MLRVVPVAPLGSGLGLSIKVPYEVILWYSDVVMYYSLFAPTPPFLQIIVLEDAAPSEASVLDRCSSDQHEPADNMIAQALRYSCEVFRRYESEDSFSNLH